ncbi:GLPGLI family protein [Moheibacter lacus]|uniref:GLPGLI family protein n=1 Tax=Moheibacter lacus TaxID=2745851 RepID=A0A838ZNN1_9FLAO|nr:GLPGLI family protein [Moheibacter lacus]MBA5629326.1 GLPGLI family protein [Moheibacter lacus]
MYVIEALLIFFNFWFPQLEKELYKVDYHYTQSLEIDENTRRSYPPEILQQIKDASNVTYAFSLYTNSSESVFKLLPKLINSQNVLAIEIEPDLKWAYKNLKENYTVNLIQFDKNYFVRDSLQKLIWRKTNEQKELLGYQTQKYFYEDENQFIEIWCAIEIHIPNGPLNYSGNENLILEAKISTKKGAKHFHHYTATEINDEIEFDFKKEKPKKVMSRERFDTLFSDYKKKIEAMNSEIDTE